MPVRCRSEFSIREIQALLSLRIDLRSSSSLSKPSLTIPPSRVLAGGSSAIERATRLMTSVTGTGSSRECRSSRYDGLALSDLSGDSLSFKASKSPDNLSRVLLRATMSLGVAAPQETRPTNLSRSAAPFSMFPRLVRRTGFFISSSMAPSRLFISGRATNGI